MEGDATQCRAENNARRTKVQEPADPKGTWLVPNLSFLKGEGCRTFGIAMSGLHPNDPSSEQLRRAGCIVIDDPTGESGDEEEEQV